MTRPREPYARGAFFWTSRQKPTASVLSTLPTALVSNNFKDFPSPAPMLRKSEAGPLARQGSRARVVGATKEGAAYAYDCDHQSKGRLRENDHEHQPGGLPGAAGAKDAAGRHGPAGALRRGAGGAGRADRADHL